MLHMFNLRRLFAARIRKPRKVVPQHKHRAQLGLEQLETRVTPARIDIVNGAAYGTASLNNTPSARYEYLTGGTIGRNLGRVTSSGYSLAESATHVSYSNWSPQSKQLELKSFANAQGNNKAATAQAFTSDNQNIGKLGWIQFKVGATAGDYTGKPVTISLSAFYQSSRNGSSSNFVQVSYYSGGQYNVIPPTSNLQTTSKSTSFKTTVGSTFYVHMNTYSYAYSNAMATGTIRLDVSVR